MSRKWTIPQCPVCGAEDEVVANPKTKEWLCFECRSEGSYELSWNVSKHGDYGKEERNEITTA